MKIWSLPARDTDPPIPTPPETVKAPFVLAVEANKFVKFRIPVEGILIPGGAEKGLFVAILYSHRSTRKIIRSNCIGWRY